MEITCEEITVNDQPGFRATAQINGVLYDYCGIKTAECPTTTEFRAVAQVAMARAANPPAPVKGPQIRG